MADAASGKLDLEALLTDALRPVEPPEQLSTRVETTLAAITDAAAAQLASWADELSESELQSLRDPRNWVRPVAAVAVGGVAAAGLALVVATRSRKRRPAGLRSTPERAPGALPHRGAARAGRNSEAPAAGGRFPACQVPGAGASWWPASPTSARASPHRRPG